MKEAGLGIRKQYLDNIASADFKKTTRNNGMDYELLALGNKRVNVAGRAIQTTKDHFVAIIAGMNICFPLHLWCTLF